MVNFLFAGVDFLIDKEGKVHFLEVNSEPGGLRSWKEAYRNLKPLQKLKQTLEAKKLKELQFLLEVQKEMLKNRFNTRKNYLSKFFDVRLCSVEENFGYLRREANKLLDVDGKIFKFDCIHLGDFVEFFPPALVINDARIMKVTKDKWKVYSLLKIKFHFPTTFLVQTSEESKQLIKKMRWKIFVLKPRYGSGDMG